MSLSLVLRLLLCKIKIDLKLSLLSFLVYHACFNKIIHLKVIPLHLGY